MKYMNDPQNESLNVIEEIIHRLNNVNYNPWDDGWKSQLSGILKETDQFIKILELEDKGIFIDSNEINSIRKSKRDEHGKFRDEKQLLHSTLLSVKNCIRVYNLKNITQDSMNGIASPRIFIEQINNSKFALGDFYDQSSNKEFFIQLEKTIMSSPNIDNNRKNAIRDIIKEIIRNHLSNASTGIFVELIKNLLL